MRKILTIMLVASLLASCAATTTTTLAPTGNDAYFQNVIGDTVRFEEGSSALTEKSKAVLRAQAEWLKSNDRMVIVEGHADEQGTRNYNLALGAERAEAVRVYLISQGVAGNRIATVSYGREQPLATCAAETCWQQNRRAQTTLV